MTIKLVQHAGADNAGTGISTSQVAFTTSVALGNVIIVGIGEFDGTANVSGVVDNIGNTYWRQVTGSGTAGKLEVWAGSITSTGTPTVKAIMAATQSGGDFIPISIAEFSGLATASAETSSVSVDNNQNIAIFSSSQVTPNENPALIYGIGIAGSGGPLVVGSGFTDIDNLPNTPDDTEYLITTGSGKIAASWKNTIIDNWVAITTVWAPTAVVASGLKGFTIQGLNDSSGKIASIQTIGGSLAISIIVT